MAIRPRTIILVPGAWHVASTYDVLIKTLESQHYAGKIVTLDLPSVEAQAGDPVMSSMLPDIVAIEKSISEEIEQGNSVLLVAHSYGSIPASCALERFADSNNVKFVILGGLMLQKGESLWDLCNGTPGPMWRFEGEYIYAKEPEHHFYNDLPEDVQQKLVAKLKSHSKAVNYAPATFEGWAHVPTTYVGCLRDNAIPVPVQDFLLNRAKERGVDVKQETIDSSHTPMVSKPEVVASILLKVAS